MFRSLLVAVKPGSDQDIVIDFSVAIAERHQLAIDACAVIDLDRLASNEPVPIGGSAFKAQRDLHAIATARQYATEAMARTEASSLARKIECTPHILEGETAAVLAAAVQRCDFMVCGHTLGGDKSERSLMHSILKHSSRPTVLIPQAGCPADGAVLVAYDGSLQAARAVASFVASGLARDREIHIVSFDNGSGLAREQAAAAQIFLQRHGMSSEVRISPLGNDVGQQILEESKRIAAGLIVMGAFGKGAVHEFFLGSATRSILNLLPLPVFLDH